MTNIIWQKSDMTLAITSIFDGSDPIEHAALLQERGDIPSTWKAIATNYSGAFPGVAQEAWEWNEESITVNAVKATEIDDAAIKAKILSLELSSGLPRALREIILKDSSNPAHDKVKTLDDEISVLRNNLSIAKG